MSQVKESSAETHDERWAIKAGWGTLGVSLAVAILKYIAYLNTGSVALYSDALECIVNVAGACAALVALSVSHRPPDERFPYGYQKAEHFSAIAEALMVLGASAVIVREAYLTWNEPLPSIAPWWGVALNGLGTALNAGWGLWLISAGRRWKSPAVSAGGRHLMTDVWASAGVLLGFGLAAATSWSAMDRIVAALVACHIAWIGGGMISESLGALMDRSDPDVARRIDELMWAIGGDIEARSIRTRQSGAVTFAEFQMLVPSSMPVGQAYDLCDQVEEALEAEFGETVISIHVEPAETGANSIVFA